MAMTLIVLAATMGNKYGGLKQLEGIGPVSYTHLEVIPMLKPVLLRWH